MRHWTTYPGLPRQFPGPYGERLFIGNPPWCTTELLPCQIGRVRLRYTPVSRAEYERRMEALADALHAILTTPRPAK